MPFTDVERLFDTSRLQSQQSLTIFLLYFPIGVILALCRILILCLLYPICFFLPRSKFRCYVLKVICFLFGALIKSDLSHLNNKVKCIICNHISIFDHLVLDSVLNCKKIHTSAHFSNSRIYIPDISSPYFETAITRICEDISVSNVPVLIFPERIPTTGKFGLLNFEVWPFTLSPCIQPVVIQYSAKLIATNLVILGSSFWKNLFWSFFTPYIVFEIKALPVAPKGSDSFEEFRKRVQAEMASAMNLTPTDCTIQKVNDYKKYLADLYASTKNTSHSYDQQSEETSQQYSEETKMLAAQVKEMFHHVPLPVILKTIEETKSVEQTVIRLSRERSVRQGKVEPETEDVASFNTAVSVFGKTPQQRMMSYQDRKECLILAARIRYIRKHLKLEKNLL